MKYAVSVERRLYITGKVVVESENALLALEKVKSMIDSGELQTTAVEWDEPQYEDHSFETTGDVDFSDFEEELGEI